MAVQILAIIKAVSPYITQIATTAIPAFTSRKEAAKSDSVLSRQIEELQTAATQNAQSIHVLAEKLNQAIHNIEEAAQAVQRKTTTYKVLLFCSLVVSVVAISMSFYAILK